MNEKEKSKITTNAYVTVDCHVHSGYSDDCVPYSIESYMQQFFKKGLDYMAIVDHDVIDGALRFKEKYPEQIIVGEEVHVQGGASITGLFIQHWIKPLRAYQDIIEDIRAQGGLVYLPHPYSRYAWDTFPLELLHQIIPLVDIVEVENARNPDQDNQVGKFLCQQHGKLAGAGSDAHFPFEIGRSYLWMPDFRDAQDCYSVQMFRQNLKDAKIVLEKKTSMPVNILSAAYYFTFGKFQQWHRRHIVTKKNIQ